VTALRDEAKTALPYTEDAETRDRRAARNEPPLTRKWTPFNTSDTREKGLLLSPNTITATWKRLAAGCFASAEAIRTSLEISYDVSGLHLA